MRMLVNRKTSKGTKNPKLKKSNVLKMNQINKTYKKVSSKAIQSEYQENVHTTSSQIQPKGFQHHFASTSQIIYTPFRKDYYLPPHLNSSNIHRTIFRSENPNWKVRISSTKKYDYDQLYKSNELKYENLNPSRRWSQTKSKIKSYLDQDKMTYDYFRKPSKLTCCQREKHPDDDLSEQSSVEPHEQ